jgi:hypothetical protein
VYEIAGRCATSQFPWSISPSGADEEIIMCRNIKTLANFEPPATDDEVRASALQFVRKLSGSTRPSRANEDAFNRAVEDVTAAARRLLQSLQTNAAPRNREEEARKARERSKLRFDGGAPAASQDQAGL